ncbi:MAG: alpha-L-rhamnosidase N-terminal domain-containing protein, partial [Acidobacteria bacterium]|nr:alpha-L-rhamnosidase N-terminal domain-containing protein [Acidobacteriota bacterium]
MLKRIDARVPKPRIGVLPTGHRFYWDLFPNLEQMGQKMFAELRSHLAVFGEAVGPELVNTPEEAVQKMHARNGPAIMKIEGDADALLPDSHAACLHEASFTEHQISTIGQACPDSPTEEAQMNPLHVQPCMCVRNEVGGVDFPAGWGQLHAIRRRVTPWQLIIGLCVGCILLIFGDQAVAQQAPTAKESVERAVRRQVLPIELKTEHLTEPLGVETPRPRFRWLLDSDERGQLQTGYQVLVATSLEKLQADTGDKWDSGKVSSDNSVEVPYGGSELASGERCYWKVRVWDKNGRPSAYSAPSFFEMGLRKQSDWQGKWIAGKKDVSSPLFRRAISIEKPVRRARMYISGLGYYELFINGKKVGDRVLEPASTNYNNDQPFKLGSRVLYSTYDV